MTLSRHQAVGAYRRWTPPAFDADEDAGAHGGTRPETHSSAEPDPDPAQAPEAPSAPEPSIRLPTADEIETMFEQARQEGHNAGYEEGRSAGYTAGYDEGKACAQKEATRLTTVVAAMDEALDRLDGEVAEELVTLAITLARQMVKHTLAEHPAAITETVKEALQQLPQSKVRVRLHPDDAALVREYLSDQLEHGHHHLIADEAVTRGGCVLEAAGCQIDATIETRWRRILEGLGRRDASPGE